MWRSGGECGWASSCRFSLVWLQVWFGLVWFLILGVDLTLGLVLISGHVRFGSVRLSWFWLGLDWVQLDWVRFGLGPFRLVLDGRKKLKKSI